EPPAVGPAAGVPGAGVAAEPGAVRGSGAGVVVVRPFPAGVGPDRVRRSHPLLSLRLRPRGVCGGGRPLFRRGGRRRGPRRGGAPLTPVEVGLVGIAVMIVLFLLRMPVAFAMALVGFVGFGYLTSFRAAASLLARDVFAQFFSYGLSAITLFVLMGSYGLTAGLGDRLYRASYGRL